MVDGPQISLWIWEKGMSFCITYRKGRMLVFSVGVRLRLPITLLAFHCSSNEQRTSDLSLFNIFVYLGQTLFMTSICSIMNNDRSYSIDGPVSLNMIGWTFESSISHERHNKNWAFWLVVSSLVVCVWQTL